MRFEQNPDLEFEFYLAEKLGGITVAELRERMSADEYMHWAIFYARRAQRQQLEQLKRG